MSTDAGGGTPFGRYRLLELLGRGGMGEVWRAHDTETDRVVAIKVLPAHFSEDQEFQRRFRREAHAAARLNSPHVVPIHNYGEIGGRLYVDMRLIEGRDLHAVLASGPLDPARAVRIIEGIALALQAAHHVGLLHRDVKPSNILLDGNDFAYLIDFGIARAVDGTRMTQSGHMIGTFQYIAPERLDSGTEDARADVYSLACVLYECLTGDPPFEGDTMPRLVAAHLSTPPPRPSIARPGIPSRLDEVIATGMAKDPAQRYGAAPELADAARVAITEQRGPQGAATEFADLTRGAGLGGEHRDPTTQQRRMPPPDLEPRNPLSPQGKAKPSGGGGQRVAVGLAIVFSLAALGLAGWAAFRPAPSGTALSSAPATQEAHYTDSQRSDAKIKICRAFATVRAGVNLNTNLQPAGGPEDVTGALAVAANGRVALYDGGQYLLARLDPATSSELADAVRKFANNLMDIGAGATSGLQNGDPGQAALLKDASTADITVTGLCK